MLLITGALFPTASQAQESTLLHDGTLRRIRVPILMYHYVSELPPDADEYRRNLTISPGNFRAHLQYMQEQGYQTIGLHDLDNALRNGAPLPERPVILTFDDGYTDHYTDAFPILREFGATGTFFVITARLDENHPRYITWEQAREMAAAGMSIEPHSKNHIELDGRDRDTLVYEILGSIQSVEYHIGQTPRTFSYPVGRYDDATLAVMAETDIRRAVTTELGSVHTTSNSLLVGRLRISGDMSAAGLRYLLENY